MSTKTETRLVEVILKGQQPNATMRELEAGARACRAQMKGLAVDSKEFAAKEKELQAFNTRLKKIGDDTKAVGGIFQTIGKEIKAVGIVAIAALGFNFITDKISNLISQNAKLSDSFADMRKTTGMNEAEVRRLNNAFSQMNTRTSTEELRNIAIAAGQLGIAKKDIMAFTVATDKLVVSLGDEFKGGAEQVTKEMGALRNIFTDIKSNDISSDMLHIGNAINELGADGAATGPVVSDFANRIGGVGINLGLTSGQVLGLSATLQELNVSTERGGTAITKILMKMTQETDKFAHVAGMSVTDFKDLVNKDLYGAFVKVAEGARSSGASATAFSGILDSLGVDGAGASEVFSKLGANTALLKQKVDLANKSLGNTDSIISEFNIKNDTFAAKMEKIGKSFTTAFVNGPIMKGMEAMADGFLKLTRNTHASSEAMQAEQRELELAKIKVLSYNVGSAERTKLLTELKEQYPDYLANLDAEKSGNDAVRKAIDGVITSMVSKIIVERKQEDLAEQAEKIADAKEDQLNAERDLLEALNRVYKENAAARGRAGSSAVKLMEVENEGLSQKDAAMIFLNETNTGLSRQNENVLKLAEALKALQKAEIAYNGENMKGMDIQKEKDELMSRLGITGGESPVIKNKNKEGDLTAALDLDLQKQLKKQREDFLKDLEKLEKEYALRGLNEEDKKRAVIEANHWERLGLAKADFDLKMRVDKLYYQDLAELEKDSVKNFQEIKLKKLAIIESEYKERMSLAGTDQAAQARAEEDYRKRLLALGTEYNDKDILARSEKGKEITAVVQEIANKETQIAKLSFADRLALAREYYKEYEGMANTFVDKAQQLLDLQKQRNEKYLSDKLKANESSYNKDEARNKEDLRSRLLTEKEYNDKHDLLVKQKDARDTAAKQKAAEKNKKIAIAQATIDGIQSVVKTLAQYAYPYNLILAALDAAIVGVEIANIKNTPAYAKGGYHTKTSMKQPGGYTDGPTLYSNSSTGVPFIAGEAGPEWIASSWMTKDPETAPVIEHLETIRKSRSFAAGGYTTSTPAPVFSADKSATAAGFDYETLNASINRLSDILEGGIEAVMIYDRFVKDIAKIEGAKNASKIG